MPSARLWFWFGDVLLPLVPAGPVVSPTTASAAVIRLRRAAQWADGQLAGVSGLPTAAVRVGGAPLFVIDRHGVAAALRGVLTPEGAAAPMRIPVGFGVLNTFRSFMGELLGFWLDGRGEPAMYLVAPNVWRTAVDNRLDQADFAKWVALRTGLWGTYFTQARWLGPLLRGALAGTEDQAASLTRMMILLSQIASAQLEQITPQQIPSVNWIRQRIPHASPVRALQRLRRFGVGVPDTVALQALSNAFVEKTGLAVPGPALTTLLAAQANVPTAEEMSHPDLWLQRVGLAQQR